VADEPVSHPLQLREIRLKLGFAGGSRDGLKLKPQLCSLCQKAVTLGDPCTHVQIRTDAGWQTYHYHPECCPYGDEEDPTFEDT
jgi:hypothetical protein